MKNILAMLGVALLIVACGSATANPAPADDPLIPPVSESTGDGWLVFSLHMTSALDSTVGGLNALTDDLNAQDYAGGVRSIDRLDDLLRDELDWLRDNEPSACYGDLHAGWTDVFTTYREALALSRPFLVDYPYGDIDDMEQATDLISGASAQTNSLTDMIEPTDVACAA